MLKDVTPEFKEKGIEKILSKEEGIKRIFNGKEVLMPQVASSYLINTEKNYKADYFQDIKDNYELLGGELVDEKQDGPFPWSKSMQNNLSELNINCTTWFHGMVAEHLAIKEGGKNPFEIVKQEREKEIEKYLNDKTNKYYLNNQRNIFYRKFKKQKEKTIKIGKLNIPKKLYEIKKSKIKIKREKIVKKAKNKLKQKYGLFKGDKGIHINIENISTKEIDHFEIPHLIETRFSKYKVYELEDNAGGNIKAIYNYEDSFWDKKEMEENLEKLNDSNPFRKLDIWVCCIERTYEEIVEILQVGDDPSGKKQKEKKIPTPSESKSPEKVLAQ